MKDEVVDRSGGKNFVRRPQSESPHCPHKMGEGKCAFGARSWDHPGHPREKAGINLNVPPVVSTELKEVHLDWRRLE